MGPSIRTDSEAASESEIEAFLVCLLPLEEHVSRGSFRPLSLSLSLSLFLFFGRACVAWVLQTFSLFCFVCEEHVSRGSLNRH